MRRLYLATLLLTAVSLMAGGCRQTTGPTSAGPLTPLGPMAPSGIAFSRRRQPNADVEPIWRGNASHAPINRHVLLTQQLHGWNRSGRTDKFRHRYSGGVCGAGHGSDRIRRAGCRMERNPFICRTHGPGLRRRADPSPRRILESTPRTRETREAEECRSSISLRHLPHPGIAPPRRLWSNQLPAPNQLNPNWQQSPPNQSFQNQSTQSPVGVRSITAPSPSEIANRLTPLPSTSSNENPINLAPFGSAVPRTATAPVQGPSTEPVTSGGVGGTQENLPWRRPGTRF